jgi:protein MpaA
MRRPGKNHGGYRGETIDVHAALREVEIASQKHGWSSETFGQQGEFKLLALHRQPVRTSHFSPRIYLSAGIHGDEPAGPLAVRQLLQQNQWPENLELRLCPCLNPAGFASNRRENAEGTDLNREYRRSQAPEIVAHKAWLNRQPGFDLSLCLHEDWESHGFYLYELNPDHRPSLAEPIVERIAEVCPIDRSEIIEGRPAQNGIIRPSIDPRKRPDWPEAFYLITHKTRLSYTLEAPSDFPLPTRVAALTAGVRAAIKALGLA